jgi:hypothetical protein
MTDIESARESFSPFFQGTARHPSKIRIMSVHEPTHREEESDVDCKPTPLPKLQIFILFLTLFSEPIAGLVIYPFINQLVRETGVIQGDEHKTGYYAGIIVRECCHQYLS